MMDPNQIKQLRQAIAILRSAAEDAERMIDRPALAPNATIYRVATDMSRKIHNAVNNAMASIESAIEYQEYVVAREKTEADYKGAAK